MATKISGLAMARKCDTKWTSYHPNPAAFTLHPPILRLIRGARLLYLCRRLRLDNMRLLLPLMVLPAAISEERGRERTKDAQERQHQRVQPDQEREDLRRFVKRWPRKVQGHIVVGTLPRDGQLGTDDCDD